MTWPLVAPNDDGIRPAGQPDECFYCRRKVGEEHKRNCTIVTKLVRIAYTYEVDVTVPYDWDEDMIHFHRNEGTWCASNAFSEIKKHLKADGCACPRTTARLVRVLDETPTRKLRAAPNRPLGLGGEIDADLPTMRGVAISALGLWILAPLSHLRNRVEEPMSEPSKGPTRGEEIAESTWLCAHGKFFPKDCQHLDCIAEDRRQSARLIDSALASQEARHQQEMEEQWEAAKGRMSLWVKRAEKAESKLREATEREKVLREAASEMADVFTFLFVGVKEPLVEAALAKYEVALAALRSGPAPQE